MALRDFHSPPTITAALGPTNTGKTYRAIRRMIGHGSGIMGLPLRLLAREVYERVMGEVGRDKVALLTGEERIRPRKPRFWICTTESMPVNKNVAFVGIDEIQLATHHERGHTFTDRILHARGLRETWFMGSDTMVPVLERLVPTAKVERYQRLSKLRHAGTTKLTGLPSRTAIVAFSAKKVYELAERLRARRGGAAVVLGALSPRARNRQVAMYQSGEVQFMVATDAIGMGLNMDVDHVAFSARRKFDGRSVRDLTPGELAQIAGRAGRHTRDGTFGTLDDVEPFEPMLVDDIEQHRFEPVRRVHWRSRDTDFESIPALIDSLKAPPPHRGVLRPVDLTDDLDALIRLGRRPDIRRKADNAERVALLWEVCRVPDFRHTMVEAHVHLLAQVYLQLTGPRGCLSPQWMAESLDHLDRVDGDIETLMARISHTRTWTYITNRDAWIAEPEAFRARAQEVEERLSDALHDALTRRFVDARTVALVEARARRGSLEAEVDDAGRVEVEGLHLGQLDGFGFEVTPGSSAQDDKAARSAARSALKPVIAEQIDALVECPDEDLHMAADGHIDWRGVRVARLQATPELLSPDVRVLRLELVDSHGRTRIHARLVRWVRDWVAGWMACFDRVDTKHLKPPARALRYVLLQRLGLVRKRDVARDIAQLSPLDRKNLARMDVRIGTELVYADRLLKPQAIVFKAALWCAWKGQKRVPELPPEGAVSVPVKGSRAFLEAIGYVPAGPRALRADQYETLLMRLRRASRDGPFQVPAAMPSWVGCTRAELAPVLEALGYRPTDDDRFLPRPQKPRKNRRGRRRGKPRRSR